MAFIRQYAAGDGLMRAYMAAGDPGFGKWLKRAFKPPKAIRKLQPLKALARVAAPVASFLPGIGGALAGALVPRPMEREPEPVPLEPEEYEAAEEYAPMRYDPESALHTYLLRYLGYAAGDPGKAVKRAARKASRVPKPAKKRKRAAAGPKAKAAAKRPKIDWGRLAEAAASGIPIAGAAAQELLGQMREGRAGAVPPELALVPGMAGLGAGKLRMPGFGKGRRTMNPANVKALRRSMRRVEGFEKLVKRVHKMFPRMKPAQTGAARAHRRGCRCFACRKAA